MAHIEALKMALSKEIETKELFEKLSAVHPAVKETFLFLANEEEKHKRLIEGKISELMR